MSSLTGRYAVVTGATGIAEATARALVDEGASVFVISIDAAEAERLTTGLRAVGADAWHAVADLRDEDATEAAFREATAVLPRVDALVAVAGGSGRRFGDGPLHEMTFDAWQATLDLNLLPPFLAARESIRIMRSQEPDEVGARGSIVLISSVLATHPVPAGFGTHAYAAAKGATESLVRATAAYYAGDGIRVNAIAPGLVDTPMATRATSDLGLLAYLREKQPLAAGPLQASDVGRAATFLASPNSARITAQILAVDGGWSVGEPRH